MPYASVSVYVCAVQVYRYCIGFRVTEGRKREEEGRGGRGEDDGLGEGGREESVKEDIDIEKVRRACTYREKIFLTQSKENFNHTLQYFSMSRQPLLSLSLSPPPPAPSSFSSFSSFSSPSSMPPGSERRL